MWLSSTCPACMRPQIKEIGKKYEHLQTAQKHRKQRQLCAHHPYQEGSVTMALSRPVHLSPPTEAFSILCAPFDGACFQLYINSVI